MTVSSVATGYDGISLLAGNAAYDPAGTFLIQRVAGTGSSGTITFSSIPQTYKHLQIRVFAISTNTTPQSGQNVTIRFNGDSGSNYARHSLEGDGNGTFLAGTASTTGIFMRALMVTSGTNIGGAGICDIHDYTSTSKNTTVRAFAGGNRNTTDNVNAFVGLFSGLYISTDAITSISLVSGSGNFTTSSQFALYGMVG
jgi:hypothetical protein